jgi:phage terminase small subunit
MKTTLNSEAAKYYRELKKILTKAGTFSPGDQKGLERLAHLYSCIDRVEEAMNGEEGTTVIRQNLHSHDKLAKNILALESAFLLNPSSRTRAKVLPKQEKKGFDTSMRFDTALRK